MRIFAFLGAGALVALGAACSSSDSGSTGAAGGGAAGSGGSGGVVTDASVDQAEDAPLDVPAETSALCPPGSVTDISEVQCSLAAQDCPTGKTCMFYLQGTNWITHCITYGTGLATRGEACSSVADCDRGLVCVSGRCSPFCCPQQEAELCGPGGTCSVNLKMDPAGQHTGRICIYGQLCDLWTPSVCPTDYACRLIGTTSGLTQCMQLGPGSPTTEGAPCSGLQDCGDSMLCIDDSNGSVCRYACRLSDTGGPAGAGTVGGAPGAGGCPSGQTCGGLQGAPSWLGVCHM